MSMSVAFAAKKKCSSAGLGAGAPRWMMIAAFALLAVLAIVLVIKAMSSPIRQGFATQQQSGTKLVFLYMTGCGWCDKFKPTWQAFLATQGKNMAAAGVTPVSYERSDPAAAAFKDSVSGYPTLLLADASNDSVIATFKGDRTLEGLASFLRSNGIQLPEGFFDPYSTYSDVVAQAKKGAGMSMPMSKPKP